MVVFHRLFGHFGPQRWWPADSPLEVMVGAILTQNTAWSNVEIAIKALRESHILSSMAALVNTTEETLSGLIRPCGYFRVKAHRIKNLIAAVEVQTGGCLDKFLSLPRAELREKLLSISGVGPETADSILLYAAKKPVFVVDAYTRRALFRHGWISPKATYDDIQSLFMEHLPLDVSLYNEYHALWVALGKVFCRPKARCSGCPLEELLDQSSAQNGKPHHTC